MSLCMSLRRVFAISRLTNLQNYMPAMSVRFCKSKFCLTHHCSLINCHSSTAKSISVLRSKQQNLCAVLKSESSWQKVTWQCGFHTTCQRNISPLLWMVIKPIAKVASMLTGRWMHVFVVDDKKSLLISQILVNQVICLWYATTQEIFKH